MRLLELCSRESHFAGRAVVRLLAGAPVLLPPYIVALAWVNLGWDRLSEWTYSLPAAIVILSLVLYPLSMLATEMAMRRIDGRLEEAGLIVAPPGRVLRRITLPLVAPSVIAAALIIFVLAVSEFGVPGLLRVRVYTTEVFTAFAALYDFQPRHCPRRAAPRAMRRRSPLWRPRCSGIGSSRHVGLLPSRRWCSMPGAGLHSRALFSSSRWRWRSPC